MKKILFIALLLLISGRVFAVDASLQAHYQRWACVNTCTKTYTETETNYFGNKVTYSCVACKYDFCMMPTGEQVFWKYNSYGKFKQGATYPFVYRWVKY